MLLNLFLNLIFKHYFFLNTGRTFNVSKITKTPFYTLNIDRITKPQKFNVKNISIQHMKQKTNKNIVYTMAY